MNETEKLTENPSCPDCGSTTSVKRDEVDSNVWNCWECGVWFDSKYEGEDDMRKRYPERAEFEDCSRLYFALTERQRRFIHAQVQGQDEREHAKEGWATVRVRKTTRDIIEGIQSWPRVLKWCVGIAALIAILFVLYDYPDARDARDRLDHIYQVADAESPELHRALDEDVYRGTDPDYVYSGYYRRQGFTSVASVRADLKRRLEKALTEMREVLEREHGKGVQ